jgi:hypothetical protein
MQFFRKPNAYISAAATKPSTTSNLKVHKVTSKNAEVGPWQEIERNVYRLQQRIYQAASRGDVRRIHNLQRLVLSSYSARLLAVRRVTQDNRGKRTAGVDGVASLTPSERLALAQDLRHLNPTPSLVRRTYIDKPGSDEKRPLGIPRYRRPALIRYADDLVILHHDLDSLEQAKQETKQWLAQMGLRLKPSKTHITHTLTSYQGKVGFDFLGFNIRQYPTTKYHTRTYRGKPGYKTLIRPANRPSNAIWVNSNRSSGNTEAQAKPPSSANSTPSFGVGPTTTKPARLNTSST